MVEKQKSNSMTRSLWKGPFSEIRTKNQKFWSRRSVILPSLIGKQVLIHNGKTFITLKVTDQMIGHKLGEFASTRKKAFHKKKKKIKVPVINKNLPIPMINTKKKITKIKTEKFLKEFPIIFLLQHNNFRVKDWLILKKQIDINQISEKNAKEFDKLNKKSDNKTQMQFLNVKNSLLKKFGVNCEFLDKNKLNFLCQGPNFLIGCREDLNFRLIWNSITSKNGPFLNTNSKLVFIACIYKNQLLNHLDLQTLVKLDGSVYSKFLHHLDKKTDLYNSLHQSLKLNPLFRIQRNFLNTLFLLKSSLFL